MQQYRRKAHSYPEFRLYGDPRAGRMLLSSEVPHSKHKKQEQNKKKPRAVVKIC